MNMKKTAALVLAAAMTAAMVACGNSNPATSSQSSTGAASSQADKNQFKADHEITVISREDGSGTRGAFIELFEILVKGADGSKTDTTTEEAIIANKTDVMLQSVSGDQYAVGYVSLGSLSDTVKAVKIEGVTPTAEAVLDGSYKVSRPFMIATKGEPDGLAKDFIDFILSADGQAVIGKSYVPVSSSAPAYAGTKPSGKIVIGGSSSVSPIMEKLREAYLAINPSAEIEVQMSDSTAGMTGAKDGVFDIGMASRELKDSEKAELTGIAIAQDGIAVIVNPQNPIEDMTPDMVKNIFTGEALTWSEVK